MEDKKPLMIMVWPDFHEAMKRQAKKERCTMTALIVRVMTQYIRRVDRNSDI